MSTPFYSSPQAAAAAATGAVSEPPPGKGPEWVQRIADVTRNRSYYDGTQYDAVNDRRYLELGCDTTGQMLPEWERYHAYSSQIAESVDFIADQLSDGFGIIAADQRLQPLIDQALDATDLFQNDSDEDIALDDLLVEAAQAGDVVYETRWNPIDGTVFWEFWQAEDVDFLVPYGRHVEKVTRRMKKIVPRLQGVQMVDAEIEEVCTYELRSRIQNEDEIFDIDGTPLRTDVAPIITTECLKRTWWDSEEQPPEWLGMPFIPWGIVRVDRRGLRGYRGTPLITRRALDNADRYNANEHTAYQIARFNSHGSLVVIGDQAYLKIEQEGGVNKDTMDVLPYPEGTQAFAVTLPTDPQMIEHTRKVTADAIYASFGLTRVEPDTLQGLGSPSGYALEILNRKSEGKLKRVRRVVKTDLVGMVNQALDLTALRQGRVLDETQLVGLSPDDREDMPDAVVENWWDIDPEAVFPNREFEIRMGAGYIVDDVMVRDDFTAGLVSQEDALRSRGRGDEDIKQIIEEQEAAKDRAAERFQAQAAAAAAAQAANQSREPEQDPNRGAGTTTGDTERR